MAEALVLLDRNPITYMSAARHDDNIIKKVAYVRQTNNLYKCLWKQRHSIEALTAHHLGLGSSDTCTVLGMSSWIRGSFNVCLPIEVAQDSVSRKVLIRFPMPHKLAEATYPGTGDEKLSSEVGTYAWMQDNCSNIPIPHLYGFGFSDGHHFTHAVHRPFHVRLGYMIRRYLYSLFRYPLPSQYTSNPNRHCLNTGYMLLEYIEPSTGQMLSRTWDKHREDQTRKQNLFRSMSRLILSLARLPQPRIGSFRFHNNGMVTLTNRPLPCSTIILENDGAPRIMQRCDTYTCTEAFVSDMLTFYDKSFLSQPNAAHSEEDCYSQMASKILFRTTSHHFLMREYRNGPFFLQLTDIHASNIFVDDEWNITCLIDLEWVCSLPLEMLAVPSWLTGQAIDIAPEKIDEFDKVRQEFMDIFKEEELAMCKKHDISLEAIMRDNWDSKRVWFHYCLTSVDAMYGLFEDYICPKFLPELSSDTQKIVAQFWCENSQYVVARKLADKERYLQQLQNLFKESPDIKVTGK